MENWSESQQQFKEISDDVEMIEVETDNHFIHYEELDLVVRIIESVANQ